MAQEDSLRHLEDEVTRRYHMQCEGLERHEDALRARERRLDQEVEEFLWDVDRSRAMVDDMHSAMPCAAHQAALAADELACAQSEAAMRLDERHSEFARERRCLERQRDQAEEEYHRAMRSCHG